MESEQRFFLPIITTQFVPIQFFNINSNMIQTQQLSQVQLTTATQKDIPNQQERVKTDPVQIYNQSNAQKIKAKAFYTMKDLNPYKSHFNLEGESRRRNILAIESDLKEFNDDLFKLGLEVYDIKIGPFASSEPNQFINTNWIKKRITCKFENKTYKNENIIEYLTLIKDECLISNYAYQRLCNLEDINLPQFSSIHKKVDEINDKFELKTNEYGVYINPIQKIKTIAELKLLNKTVDAKDNILTIRLAGDSAWIGKNKTILHFGFSIIEQIDKKPSSEHGFYTLGIFDVDEEDYDSINGSIKDILNVLENFKEFQINDQIYKIKYRLGGDLKFLSLILGIDTANSTYPCIWCFYNKNSRNIKEKDSFISTHSQHSIFDRKIEDAKYLHQNKEIDERKGHKRHPIITFIEYNDVIVDSLHLLIRVCESLFHAFTDKLKCIDSKNYFIKHGKIFPTKVSLEDMPAQKLFFNTLKINCNIKYGWDNEKKRYEVKSLTGLNCWKFFFFITTEKSLSLLFPNVENIQQYELLFINFFKILLNVKLNRFKPNEIQNNTENWLTLYLKTYSSSRLTPYIHIFVAHLHQFAELVGNVNAYNCNGLEKANHIISRIYFRGTNKKDDHLIQLISKKNRTEYLRNKLSKFDIDELKYDEDELDSDLESFDFKIYNYFELYSDERIQSDTKVCSQVSQEDETIKNDFIFQSEGNSNNNPPKKDLPKKKCDKAELCDQNKNIKNNFSKEESFIDLTNANISKTIMFNESGNINHKKDIILDLKKKGEASWLHGQHIYSFLNLTSKKFKKFNIIKELVDCRTTDATKDNFQNRYIDINKSNTLFVLNSRGNHWIALSNVNCPLYKWNYYDSLNSQNYIYGLKNVLKCFAEIYQSASFIELEHHFVSPQRGSSDCGLYALAYIYAICDGEDPKDANYDQKEMRKHFNRCIEKDEALPFIQTKKKSKRKCLDSKIYVYDCHKMDFIND